MEETMLSIINPNTSLLSNGKETHQAKTLKAIVS